MAGVLAVACVLAVVPATPASAGNTRCEDRLLLPDVCTYTATRADTRAANASLPSSNPGVTTLSRICPLLKLSGGLTYGFCKVSLTLMSKLYSYTVGIFRAAVRYDQCFYIKYLKTTRIPYALGRTSSYCY
jgi:hypothetical protein